MVYMKTVEKKKRIKRVFSSSSEVLHMWAAQTQHDARQGGNRSRCYFEGTKCYSYGQHYQLGELVKINGIQCALINTDGYSVTTRSHISYAKDAVSHMPTIEVDSSFDWKQGLLNMQDALVNSLFDQLERRAFWEGSKAFDKYKREQFNKFNTLCVIVGMPQLQLFPDSETLEVLNHHINNRLKRQTELAVAKRIKDSINYAEEIEAWKTGGPFTAAVMRVNPQLIRVNGEKVETSSRASVPLYEALRALMLLENSKLKSNSKIGSYTFNKVDKGMVKIGCHTIELEQAKSVLTSARKAG